MRLLTEESIEDIALGAAVLGTGGGGDPYIGMLMARQAIRDYGPVELYGLDELNDDDLIVPTAMSGLFSAVMIGLGRAVGETMIVLMAAGNTPVMDWNIFNGFRTLSANIAVELPEAARDTTHYRVLFLAALTLFLMTFVLNTLAEVVRSRFRKRAFQL